MLLPEEGNAVFEELSDQFALGGADVPELVATWIGMRHLRRIDYSSNPQIYAQRVLDYVTRYGWIELPALLQVMLEKLSPGALSRFAANIPSIAARIAAIAPLRLWAANSSAWDTALLSLELPFLNRETTRRAFEHFDERLPLVNSAARVLVVNGPPGSGKSFTGDFLRLLVSLRPDTDRIAFVNFAAWTGSPLTPDLLAKELARQMGVTPEQTSAAGVAFSHGNTMRPERLAKGLVISLAAVANLTGKRWHIVLDNFHLPGVPDATYTFIEQLLSGLASGHIAWDVDPSMGPPLRLVLLGYTRPLPVQNYLVRVEEISPITRDDLAAHFRRYYEFKQWPYTADEIDAIVARYEPRLKTLFPTSAASRRRAPRWRMDKLAEVVRLDCAKQEDLRAAAVSPAPVR
jgi:hypothetical protein